MSCAFHFWFWTTSSKTCKSLFKATGFKYTTNHRQWQVCIPIAYMYYSNILYFYTKCETHRQKQHMNFPVVTVCRKTKKGKRILKKNGKSILQVPDTGTWVLDNTKPFLCSSIVNFWITLAHSKEHKYHIFRQYWYTRNVPVFTNTGTFQYPGPQVYFFQKNNK